ncbi:carboxylesterase/lipase family protein [Nakamurella leprariae]|uniref:Carboxylic ester hydrolase n=1 Tax=Nakamurella leprariae TaxID=2803911 RepID=A0A938YGB6_9ACTN|nr:carboxylesterase family protein [Nakamurella leprariae]MBM9468996.1 carboxylesterase family protein [Nakamurella leprariae]
MRISPARRTAPLLTLLALTLLVLAGCTGGSEPGPTSAPTSPSFSPVTSSTVAAPDGPPTAVTSSGTLTGTTTPLTRQFLGVRYAQPPVGERRWTLPEVLPPTSEPVDATASGAACAPDAPTGLPPGSTVEDCLFLNVTTPLSADPATPVPVMVWWHGGGFTDGSGAEYDAQRLASRGDVIVVTVNYRLGIFGYLGLPGLPGSGNFGLADQIAATRWVKDNAAAFGGDPDDLTVFGESAGGMSACAFLTSPAATGLVAKVAVSSGSCALSWPAGTLYPGLPASRPYVDLSTSQALGTGAAATLGCADPDPIACLRALPAETLAASTDQLSNSVAFGTDLLPLDPAVAVAQGEVAEVPVLSGGTQDEARSFVAAALTADPASVTEQTYPSLLRAAFGESAATVQEQYPLSAFDSPGLAWAAVISDSAWACPTLHADQQLAGATTVYGFEFADPQAPNVNGLDVPSVPLGATHATELPFLFDLGGTSALRTPEQQQLSDAMIDAWSAFARIGVPVADGLPDWPAMTASSTHVMRLVQGGSSMVDAAAEHRCDFWAGITPAA